MAEPLRPIEMIPTAEIVPYQRNARKHSKKQINKIIRSIKEFDVTNPLIVDEQNVLLAGHGRLEAAKRLNMREVPCIRMIGLRGPQKAAYRLADNAIADESTWDLDQLADEIKVITSLDCDPELTGFDQPDIDRILDEFDQRDPKQLAKEDAVPPPDTLDSATTHFGDEWILGNHKLVCGNARDKSAIAILMGGASADVIFTDPPWNVPIMGHVSGKGKNKRREFFEASGEMSQPEFLAFLNETFGNAGSVCRDGAIAYVCIDWRGLLAVLTVCQTLFSELKNIIVWNKRNAGMGTFYRSQHELVVVCKVGSGAHTNNFGLGERGRHRSNVWTYAGANSFGKSRDEELAMHPTVKPVAMIADALRDVSNRGELILDPFGGSGSTLIAAEKTGRCARLLEIDPIYCDVIIRRWQKQTGKTAILADGRCFEEVEASRTAAAEEIDG
ncbi:site-specific DNA-methyltransferase [uncultured Sphingomonas sp.]|uniref:site-specific DNA-methyltransferase n=1 Tax=uncultured Sphingomonas sp. TaxID=158754 RepID=UPI0025E080DC|nr:site-specific DNA-methyltransferase [uncultured Sphingomonas sp.]